MYKTYYRDQAYYRTILHYGLMGTIQTIKPSCHQDKADKLNLRNNSFPRQKLGFNFESIIRKKNCSLTCIPPGKVCYNSPHGVPLISLSN